jgi:hypothetical protein
MLLGSAIAGMLAIIGGVVYLAYKLGKSYDEKLEQFEADLKQTQEEAQRHANTPANPNDAVAKLRERAEFKRSGPPRH